MRSSAPPRLLALLAAGALLAACEPGPPRGVSETALSEAIGAAIGDPATCVVLADTDGRILYRYQALAACARALPTCADPASRTAEDLAKLAARGHAEQSTCGPASWAAGPTPREGVVYAAVMEGERALPGREIARRLEGVFARTGF